MTQKSRIWLHIFWYLKMLIISLQFHHTLWDASIGTQDLQYNDPTMKNGNQTNDKLNNTILVGSAFVFVIRNAHSLCDEKWHDAIRNHRSEIIHLMIPKAGEEEGGCPLGVRGYVEHWWALAAREITTSDATCLHIYQPSPLVYCGPLSSTYRYKIRFI